MEWLSVYIPFDRRKALALGAELPDRAHGSGLFADISGFIPLTDELTLALGPERGVEELVLYLNRIYDALIIQVDRYGGSTIAFSGDAITCWFDGDDGKRATAAALGMQSAMQQFENLTIPHVGTVSISVKVGVVAGGVRRFLVGDPSIQIFDVLAGATLDRLAAAESVARKGEVVLDGQTWEVIAPIAELRERRTQHGVDFAVCGHLTAEIPAQPWEPLAADALQDEQIRNWVPESIYERLKRGEKEFIADLRLVVALFLNFSGIDYDSDLEAGLKLDRFTRRVQQIIARYEGALLELTFGDKGSHLYVTFGAPVAHEDDPERAMSAAKELCSLSDELDFIRMVRIGISRGRMRAGAYGSRDRHTYSVHGDEVNLAARLMELAVPGQILVGESIVNAVGSRYRFNPLGKIRIKGKQNTYAVFQVLGKEMAPPPSRPHTELVGRTRERALISEKLSAFVENKRSGVLVFEGEAGLGKSRLVEYLQAQAQTYGITTLFGSGDAIEKVTPYYAWQPIFAQLFKMNALPDENAMRRQYVISELQAWAPPELVRLTPLLSAVLPLDFPDNDLTEQLSGQVRAENTYALLVQVLQHRADAGPVVIFLEDAHWLDTASWALCLRVSLQVRHVLQVVATRPQVKDVPSEYQNLLLAEGAQHISLEAMHDEEVQTLIAQSLGVSALPPLLTNFILEKAEGNPFFSIELGYALREKGLILIDQGACRVAPNVDLNAAGLPDTVQEVITSRVDLLTPTQQLTLKVASVIGRVFAYRILYDTFPVETDRPRLNEQLGVLTQLDLTALEQTEPEIEYIFRHVIIQEVSYNLLLFAQRHELHRVIAEWYERTHRHNLARFYALLAYHWEKAEVSANAINYLEQAGDQALHNFANAEAISFFERALQLADAAENRLEPDHRARLELRAGEAHANLSHYLEARTHIEHGLMLLGTPLPKGKPQQIVHLLRELLHQVRHRILPGRYVGRLALQREQLLPAALAYERLGEAAYFTGEPMISLYSEFRNLNLTEEVGPSPELGRGTAAVGALIGFIPLHKVAQGYLKRALEIAQVTQHLESREFVLMSAAYYYSGIGDWAQVEACGKQLIQIAKQLGDGRRWQDGVGILMSMQYFQGEFTASARLADELYAHAGRQRDLRYLARGIQGKAYSELHLGNLDEALRNARELQDLYERDQIEVLQLRMELWGLLALILLRKEEYVGAVEAAQKALALTAKARAIFYAAFMGYAAPTEVFLTLRENGDHSAENLKLARLALDTLDIYARVFPIGGPRYQLQRGRYAWLEGKGRPAQHAWNKGLEQARRLGMLYDQGLAHYEIARHLPEDHPAHADALEQAEQILGGVKAAYDLERVRGL